MLEKEIDEILNQWGEGEEAEARLARKKVQSLGGRILKDPRQYSPLVDMEELSVEMIRAYRALPLEEGEKGVMMAVSPHFTVSQLEDLDFAVDGEIDLVIVPSSVMDDWWKDYTPSQEISRGREGIAQWIEDFGEWERGDGEDLPPEGGELAGHLLVLAWEEGGGEILFQPEGEGYEISVKKSSGPDGLGLLSSRGWELVVDHFRHRAGMEEGKESRGFFDLHWRGEDWEGEFRLFSPSGEEGGMIYLSPGGSELKEWPQRHLPHEAAKKIESILERGHGLVLVTGPREEGKTSLVYSCLESFDSGQEKIITVEEQVSYIREGLIQCQWPGENRDEMIDSASLQKPDVLYFSLRGEEDLTSLLQLATQGILVFAEVRDSGDSLAQLEVWEKEGAPSHLILSSIQGAISLRRLRKLCRECREETRLGKKEMEEIFFGALEIDEIAGYYPSGCQSCLGTGYRGFFALTEVLNFSPIWKEFLPVGLRLRDIRPQDRVPRGFRFLDAARQALERGLTSPEELRLVSDLWREEEE